MNLTTDDHVRKQKQTRKTEQTSFKSSAKKLKWKLCRRLWPSRRATDPKERTVIITMSDVQSSECR